MKPKIIHCVLLPSIVVGIVLSSILFSATSFGSSFYETIAVNRSAPTQSADSLPPDSASFVYRGTTIHRGQAILPVGYWVEYTSVANKLAALRELGPAKFDVISYGVSRTKSDSLVAFVNEMDNYGVRLIHGLYGGDSPITGEISPLQDWVLTGEEGRPIRESQALLGYYHSDDVTDLRPEDLIEKERVVKEVAPDRITAHSTGVATPQSALVQYAQSADMPGIQLYPAGSYWAHNIHFHTQRQAEATRERGGVAMAIGQTHSLSEYFPNDDLNARWPTPAETELYTYLSLAAGAKSIFFYTYGNEENEIGVEVNPGGLAQYRPQVWQKTIQLREEIATLERMLLFGRRTTTPERTFDVYYGRWIYGNKVYVAAINSLTSGQPLPGNVLADAVTGRTQINVPLPEGTQGPARPLFNKPATLSVEGNQLSGVLDITSVQLYELDYLAPTLTNGSFEAGLDSWAAAGNGVVVQQDEANVLQASSQVEATSVSQDITHRILPNQPYTFSAELKGDTASQVTAFVQVRNYRNEIIFTESLAAASADFKTQSLTFTAPEEFGSVVVGVWRGEQGRGEAFVDNLRITEAAPPQKEEGEGLLTIRAQGDCGDEVMELHVDGSKVAEWPLTTTPQNYSYSDFTQGKVSVHFVGDRFRDGKPCEDSNLTVDYLEVCGTRYQTEEVATKSTTDCCPWDADKLYNNGSLTFGTLNCVGASENLTRRSLPSQSLRAYPNPASQLLTVRGGQDYGIILYDLTGRPVMRYPHLRGQATLDISPLRPGIYLLESLDTEGETVQQRVIIE